MVHIIHPVPEISSGAFDSASGPATARSRWVPPGRTLHINDVENLFGGPFAGTCEMKRVREEYLRLAPVRDDDHVVSACNPRFVHDASAVWLRSRWLIGRGKDGADRALLRALDPDDVARRYCRVVIGSGDGAFVDLARGLHQRGQEVWVVARPGSLARALGRIADVVAFLPPAQPPAGMATGDLPDAA